MAEIEIFSAALCPLEGPYWLGAEISLVDLTYYPWFEQMAVLDISVDFNSRLNSIA